MKVKSEIIESVFAEEGVTAVTVYGLRFFPADEPGKCLCYVESIDTDYRRVLALKELINSHDLYAVHITEFLENALVKE